jgi:hypothetical protein
MRRAHLSIRTPFHSKSQHQKTSHPSSGVRSHVVLALHLIRHTTHSSGCLPREFLRVLAYPLGLVLSKALDHPVSEDAKDVELVKAGDSAVSTLSIQVYKTSRKYQSATKEAP